MYEYEYCSTSIRVKRSIMDFFSKLMLIEKEKHYSRVRYDKNVGVLVVLVFSTLEYPAENVL